jgi:hypothetical protein
MIQVCISTGNQTVNLIPAMKNKASKLYVISTDFASNKGWTSYLALVAKRKSVEYEIINIDEDKVDLDGLLKLFDKYDKIEWNITGGKKSLAILLLELYQRRRDNKISKDTIIYLERGMLETYDGYQRIKRSPVHSTLTLEDILNLYGYTYLNKDGNLPDCKLSSYKFKNDKISILNSMFFDEENRLFKEFFYDFLYYDDWHLNVKEKIGSTIEKYLKKMKPNMERIVENIDTTNLKNYETLHTAVERLKSDHKNRDKIVDEIKKMANSETIFNHFWGQIRIEITNYLTKRLEEGKPESFWDKQTGDQKEELNRMLIESGANESNLDRFVDFGMSKGFLFEEMLFQKIKDLFRNNNDELERCYVNVATFKLATNSKGEIEYPAEYKDNERDDEFDLIYVKNDGTLLIFEAKTFGFDGDTLKSMEESAFKKSGTFGKNIFVIPLLSYLQTTTGSYPKYISESLTRAIDNFDKHRVGYKCLDQIGRAVFE